MNEAYRDLIADAGAAAITHIALFDDTASEISGGDYSRKAVTWTSADNGTVRPDADLVFDIPAGATVAEWRGFSADSGGTDYGGASLDEETFNNAGTYTLLSGQTGIHHQSS